ncbi:MAG: 3'-5' exonuclease [Candidatus Buchananbacteria bacterium]
MTDQEREQKYQNFLQTEFTVFDLETSGLYPERDEILEIAAIKIKGSEEVGRFERLIRPLKPVPPEAEKIHGLNEIFLLVNGGRSADVINDFLQFAGDSIIVGHNIKDFDWLFLLEHCKKNSVSIPQNKMIDTLELSRKLLALSSYTLINVAKHFGLEHINAHRAMPDVEFNTKVFLKLMDKLLKE